MTAADPSADWATLSLAASSTDASAPAFVPLSLFGSDGVVTAAVVLAVAAILVSACAAAFFIHRGAARGFSVATTALIGVNVLALALQVAEATRVHLTPPIDALFTVRNVWMALSTVGLNLLQVEVAAVFQGSLIRLSYHLYLDGWAPGFSTTKQLGIHILKVGMVSFGIYTLLVGACGIALNTYLLVSVRRNTTQRIQMDREAMALATLGKECVRPLQGLIAFIIVLDFAGLSFFMASSLITSGQSKGMVITIDALLEISLALFGMHMSAETIMFERVVMIFRNKMPKEYVASVGIDNWHLGADVEATLEDMNATSGRTQRVDTLTRLEAIALRQLISPDGTAVSPTASKSGFEPIDKTALSSTQLPSTSNASIETTKSDNDGVAARQADPSSREARRTAGGSSQTRDL
nr:hypothetical protein HK105_006165 [Polyrhizophydium stewartii]